MLDAGQQPRPTPLTLREPADAGGRSDIADVHGVDSDGRASFQQFVDEHRHLMSDYIARRMRGTPELCAEDALQEALIRMWQQWRHWPQNPERREIYMRQALKVAAVDAIRARYGRNLNRPREYSVNFADLDRCIPTEPGPQAIIRELGLAIARESLERRPEHRDIERSVLVAAFAALTDFERRVLFMTARGDNGAQIAQELGVRHQLVRETLMRSRRLVRSLIEHADAGKVSPKEARRLWNLRDGNLSGRSKREAQRHLKHCTTCRRLAGIEDTVSEAGVRVFLPLPAAAILAASGATGSAATGAGSTTPAGGALAATGGGLLSGATAKAAVALGVLAVSGSFAGTGKLYRDRDRPQPVTAPALAAAAHPNAATRAARRARKPAKTKTRSERARKPARPATSPAATTTSRRSTASTRALPTPQAASPAASPTVSRTSARAGGEFVLGGP